MKIIDRLAYRLGYAKASRWDLRRASVTQHHPKNWGEPPIPTWVDFEFCDGGRYTGYLVDEPGQRELPKFVAL